MGRSRVGFLVVVIALASVIGPSAPGGAAEQQTVATVDRSAYFTRPATEATPPLLLDGFPPGTACLVAGLAGVPELCGEEVKDAADLLGLGDGVPVPGTIEADLVQPVQPGTMPVGMSAGQERYSSLLRFQLPPVPDGQRFGRVELLLRPDGLSYAAESPAFREAVLAAVSQISETDPAAFAEVLADVAAGDVPLVAETVTGIEACPVVEEWDGGDAQNAGLDGSRLPDVDCLLGTTGSFDDSSSTWVFDVSFAAQAWTTGGIDGEQLANEGILLRPLGAENLAYGDPDLSTNWLVSLADGEAPNELRPRLRYTLVPDDEPIAPATDVADPTFESPATPSVAPAVPDIESPAAPATAVVPGAIRARYAERAATSSDATNPWWIVLIVPIVLGGAWLLGESLLAGPAVNNSRAGALDRLMRHTPRPEGGSR